MTIFTGNARLFIALAFAITIYPFYYSAFLQSASSSWALTVHGEQQDNGIDTGWEAESTGTPAGAAPGTNATYVTAVNDSSAEMNVNWDIAKSFKRLSSYDGRPRKFEGIVRSVSHRHGVDPVLVWSILKFV